MPTITVVTPAGQQSKLDAYSGMTLMETLRDAGFDDIQALCGGTCACATCHVFIDPAFMDKLTPMSADEEDLLSAVDARRPQSRLSCQIVIDDNIDGMEVIIAPEA